MPVLIRTLDEIMRERQADVYLLQFNIFAKEFRTEARRQLEWFDEREVNHEVAAPSGWLEGDPGCHAIYFEGRGDERLADYCAAYEDKSGGSLMPDLYQMYVVSFELWAKRKLSLSLNCSAARDTQQCRHRTCPARREYPCGRPRPNDVSSARSAQLLRK